MRPSIGIVENPVNIHTYPINFPIGWNQHQSVGIAVSNNDKNFGDSIGARYILMWIIRYHIYLIRIM